jgi:hypothetical protein
MNFITLTICIVIAEFISSFLSRIYKKLNNKLFENLMMKNERKILKGKRNGTTEKDLEKFASRYFFYKSMLIK